jgi:hypothetical protein
MTKSATTKPVEYCALKRCTNWFYIGEGIKSSANADLAYCSLDHKAIGDDEAYSGQFAVEDYLLNGKLKVR